ncbi:MAG TPA: GerMN domain-containing protein [Acidimicrobiales bacterium]|nr:GerMN domain-containing protein [Acidimicrobiales bacterium]
MTIRSARRRFCVLAAVAGWGLSLAACGIPIDSKPHVIPSSAVPFGLLSRSSATTSTTSTTIPVGVSVKVFLYDSTGKLSARQRQVPAYPPAGELDAVLNALVDGPTSVEIGAGFHSAIPPQTRVLHASEASGIATVDLSTVFGQLVGPPQIQAVAQFVFTATALPGVSGVTFQLDGNPIPVPVASGAQVPVAEPAQFASLLPPPNPTSTP